MFFKKLTVVHIHTDFKFVSETNRFDGDYFDNQSIIIENKFSYDGLYKNSALIFKNSTKNISKIVQICNQSDLVILYDLTPLKVKIALLLAPEVKIAWRFFGYELYGKMPDYCFSVKTKIALKLNWFEKFIKPIFNPKTIIISLLHFFVNEKTLFKKAIERINFFLTFSPEEYEFLKEYFPYLPPLIKLSIDSNVSCEVPNLELKSNIVVVGNNRSAYNNHLDIIEIISNIKTLNSIEFQLLFNYGPDNSYTKSVREYATKCPNINVVESFMPIDEFNSYYQRIIALVLNGYRQMALGNIFEGIKNGVKIYLSPKNMSLYWLKNEGFIIYTIADFENDIMSNNFKLSNLEIQHNIDIWNKFSSSYSITDFQDSMYKAIVGS